MSTALLVVSPHLDDAVLSCAGLLAATPGAVVATVMAGNPGPGVLSGWDRTCGFSDGDDPMAARREEDRRALAVVGAVPWHLDFLDLPYREGGGELSPEDVAAQLRAVVASVAPAKVAIPLGLLHPDHELTHEAGALLVERGAPAVWAYRDLPYALARPGLVDARLANLERRGINARPEAVTAPADASRKAEAIACYASQVAAVRDDLGAAAWEGTLDPASERYWRLELA